MEIAFRPAASNDIDRLVEIHFAAYPSVTSVLEHERTFTANPFGLLDDLWVAEVAGDVVAFAFLYPFEAHYGGRPVRLGGIASLAVAPEVRGRGVAAALLAHLHVVSEMRGDALTMLHAFREGFYTRLGYALTAPRKRLAISPRAIPDSWRRDVTISRARGEDHERIRAAHARTAKRSTGWITRPPGLWDRLFARPTRHLLVAGECGYVAFSLLQGELHARTTLEVEEVVADDDATRRALLGALGAMRDQVAEIVLEVALDDAIDQVLVDVDAARFGDADVERTIGVIAGGPLVRIEEPTRAIEARGYLGEGTLDVVLGDEMAFSIHAQDGRASVSAARGGGAFRTSRRTLGAILFGGLAPSDAASLGLAEGDPKTIGRADAIMTLPKACPIDRF